MANAGQLLTVDYHIIFYGLFQLGQYQSQFGVSLLARAFSFKSFKKASKAFR